MSYLPASHIMEACNITKSHMNYCHGTELDPSSILAAFHNTRKHFVDNWKRIVTNNPATV